MPFPSVAIVRQGQSITGSFNRIQSLASGSVVTAGGSAFAVGHITALKDGNGNSLTTSGPLFLPPGAVIELMITSASLDATSAPIMFFQV
jgi:hypothetical protein